MNKKNAGLLILGVILIIISIRQIRSAQSGLSIISLPSTNPPTTIITPKDSSVQRPTVLIAHGLAGSGVLMRGFALTLAHAGYTTVSWDFAGHGYNPHPMDMSAGFSILMKDAESALMVAETTGLIEPYQIAILGHSMGSGVALSYGVLHPDTSGTIAISPVNQSVTPTLPRNLLLMAGSLEPQFASNADHVLSAAGGQNGDFSTGTARKLVIIPNVEHISILFSPTAHQTARTWLDEIFGKQTGAVDYVDRRMLWFGIGILGAILIGSNSLNMALVNSQATHLSKPIWLKLLAIFAGGILTTILLWLGSRIGINLSHLMGLLVGGYMLLWFGIAGLIGLIILRPKIMSPTLIEIAKGLLAFTVLWLGVGLLGNFVWLPWLLISNRLILWIPCTILILPWFFLVGTSINISNPLAQIGWWIIQSLTIILSLFLAIRLNPELGFLFILLPVIPVMIGLHMLVISGKHGNWSYAISGAAFTAWLVLAVFPLQ